MGYNLVSFSGGKDSTAMLLECKARGVRVDEIVYVETGKMWPEGKTHIERVKREFRGVKFTTLYFDFDYVMFEKERVRGKNKGKKGYGWPSNISRWCTAFKRDLIERHIKRNNEEDVTEFIGFNLDEVQRVRSIRNAHSRPRRFPLIEWRITGAQALDACFAWDFNWGGLYERVDRMNCWCCPLQRLSSLEYIFRERQELWLTLREMDSKTSTKFRRDYTVKELEIKFRERRDT